MNIALRALGNAALDLLAPPSCPGCGAGLFSSSEPTSSFCDSCELAIAPRDPAGCASCDQPNQGRGLCRACRRKLTPLTSIAATFDYEGPIAAALQSLKYQGRDDRLRPLARRWLAEWSPPWQAFGNHLILPVPLHPRRLAARGFDQSWLLAREVAKSIGAQARARALRRIRATPPQVGLGRAAREINVRGAFAADDTVAQREILLIDDVTTTGSTLRACAEALMQAGARSVRALVVARAQP
jgi:ComF family protein